MPSELVSPFETKFYIILHFQTFPSLCLKRLNVSLPFFFQCPPLLCGGWITHSARNTPCLQISI